MKKVIITGATGIIGKEALIPLLESGFEVYAIARNEKKYTKNIKWIKADIFDCSEMKNVFENIKPEYLLHFAWYTGEGYLESTLNYKYLEMSLNILKEFKENDGKRAVFAGTCFEYKFKDEPIKETDEILPQTIYAQCKNELRTQAELYSKENNISFGWGRIFYVYGHNENENRLFPYIINTLKQNKKVTINSGNLIRDYMYTKDIAQAFVAFLASDVIGSVNVCTGKGILLKDIALQIARKIKKETFLIFNSCNNQPKSIIGNNNRLLKEVDYKIQYALDEALPEIVERYKT